MGCISQTPRLNIFCLLFFFFALFFVHFITMQPQPQVLVSRIVPLFFAFLVCGADAMLYALLIKVCTSRSRSPPDDKTLQGAHHGRPCHAD